MVKEPRVWFITNTYDCIGAGLSIFTADMNTRRKILNICCLVLLVSSPNHKFPDDDNNANIHIRQ